ncbi:unnamed protein product, partial [Staurois parvus]
FLSPCSRAVLVFRADCERRGVRHAAPPTSWLPRLHPDRQCLPRSAGRIKRVLTFGAAAQEEGGERAPGTQKSRIEVCKEAACGSRAAAACHLVGSVLRSRSKGERAAC